MQTTRHIQETLTSCSGVQWLEPELQRPGPQAGILRENPTKRQPHTVKSITEECNPKGRWWRDRVVNGAVLFTTCQNIFPTPCSSCLEPFTSYLPHSRNQLSLQFQITLYTQSNPISKNTILEQCSKANERVLAIALGPTSAVFCVQRLSGAKAQHQG